jgi:hypothetical protein
MKKDHNLARVAIHMPLILEQKGTAIHNYYRQPQNALNERISKSKISPIIHITCITTGKTISEMHQINTSYKTSNFSRVHISPFANWLSKAGNKFAQNHNVA